MTAIEGRSEGEESDERKDERGEISYSSFCKCKFHALMTNFSIRSSFMGLTAAVLSA